MILSKRSTKNSSRRKLKFFAKKIEIVREENQNCSRRKSKMFANFFQIVREQFFVCLSRISERAYQPSAVGPECSVSPAFFPFGSTCSYVTSFSVKYFEETRVLK